MSPSTSAPERMIFDLHVPINLCLPYENQPKPVSLCTVMARVSYTVGGRLRVSVGDAMILDRRGSEPCGDLFNIRRLDRILGPVAKRRVIEGLLIGKKRKEQDTKEEDKTDE